MKFSKPVVQPSPEGMRPGGRQEGPRPAVLTYTGGQQPKAHGKGRTIDARKLPGAAHKGTRQGYPSGHAVEHREQCEGRAPHHKLFAAGQRPRTRPGGFSSGGPGETAGRQP